MGHPSDTIAAIATPAGSGGVGIVRVSGRNADSVLRALVPAWPADHPTHKLRLSSIRDLHGEVIDESLVVMMCGPHSYTGEDVVEFQCHGGPIILKRVLDACLGSDARMAEPGEFTQRAYLNGKLDLTQAEAVADLVNATNEAAHKLAMEHLQGRLGREITEYREQLTQAMVLVESAIDFSLEEHVYQIERDEILRRLDAVNLGLSRLRDTFDQGRRQREGVRVVILGPTNAGKSTLFNALHGSDRAIVTAIEGTTRDFLEEEIQVDGVALRIVDTAGLRHTEDEVEAIGIERSRALRDRADIIVWLIDRSKPLPESVIEELEGLEHGSAPVVLVANKSDMPNGLRGSDLALINRFDHVIHTALTQACMNGFDELLRTLSELGAQMTSGEGTLISRARHLQHVIEGLDALSRARNAVTDKLDHEFIALDIREALDALGEIVGHVSTDAILNRIFSEFCVGK